MKREEFISEKKEEKKQRRNNNFEMEKIYVIIFYQIFNRNGNYKNKFISKQKNN